MKSIPYGKHHITEKDINAVVDVLESDFLTQGPKIKAFENAFAKYVDARYAIAVSNGTAALHLCTLALGLKPGQKVITTPITFAASANCIRYCGGEVVFADIDPETYLLDINSVKGLLESSPKGTYAGIIPVDFAGRATNLEEFRNLANEYNLWIIQDSCHAPGGYFIDSSSEVSKCGSGQYADLAIFSFHPVKHIACGEGGMITTRDEHLSKKIQQLRTHGITKDHAEFINSVEIATGSNNATSYPLWYMEMQDLGFNYRLSEIQAALGLSQLDRANENVQIRSNIAAKYFKAFSKKPFIYRQSGIIQGHAYHLYIIEVKDRQGLYHYLRNNNIFSQIHYFPCHLMPYYQNLGWKQGDMQHAEEYYENCISLPIYPTLTEAEQQNIIDLTLYFYE